jgi:hypothetical protein
MNTNFNKCTTCTTKKFATEMDDDALQGTGHKFVPTGRIYFTSPTTYQYVHLNTGIRFRSEKINCGQAGADWLASLFYLQETKRAAIFNSRIRK